jgi:hypothetical protein
MVSSKSNILVVGGTVTDTSTVVLEEPAKVGDRQGSLEAIKDA